ncbi:helix-turn-helix transcriptional regulator [Gallaecimonas kandeliae]|uniref:helix-turn-helix domain-containing protein n=1 Tax=Gallaecimonas kandeliae TaxID=3029055 RepID=UPI002649BEC7|nr:helix-turn-helix transcriptional regulator [Gallaecimonas kandeliae]WKE64362.1 helix-turn-helix transcriptional regulator [Gallaecimonas kandeliae]
MSKHWLVVLQEQTEKASQRQVAAALGVSASMVNQVLKGTYKGDLDTLRVKVEGHFMHSCVKCPVMGEIPIHECKSNQERPFKSSNPLRVKLFRACRAGCPHSQLENTAKTQRITPVQGQDDERYPLDTQLDYCRRMAQSPAEHAELLERELSRLANRYNALVWAKRHQRNKG